MLEVKNLSASYGDVKVFSDLSFEIKKGDYLVIVGENGSGKSTLMKTILGLKKPDKGEVIRNEFTEIGYVPQINSAQKNFPALVSEVILSGLIEKKKLFFTKEDRRKLDEILKLLNIEDLKDKPISNLSGGQEKRVMLARAMIRGAEILFLDEPTTALDPIATAEFYDEVDRLNHTGETIVIISHDVRNVINCANKVLHLGANNSGILFFGEKDEYVKSDLFRVLNGVHIHE